MLSNTHQNLEIICINDGSTDNSLGILRDYETRDNRILVIDKENGGVSSARNAGLDAASGEYITFIDPDDWVHPQYFKLLLHHLINNDASFSACSFRKEQVYVMPTLSNDSPILVKPLKLDSLFEIHRAKACVCGHIYRSDILSRHRFSNNISIAEDTLFNFTLFLQNSNITGVYVDVGLYYYFQRPSSAMHSLPSIKLLDACHQYLILAKQNLNSPLMHHCLIESMKKCLSARYDSYLLVDRAQLRECNTLYKECLLLLFKNRYTTFKTKIQYLILLLFPEVYRQYRIKEDPSMLEWEKVLKSRHCT